MDVGIAQLSMHSIREQCGADDVAIAYDHFLAFFKEVGAAGERERGARHGRQARGGVEVSLR